jgi:signal transduction histidine kinase
MMRDLAGKAGAADLLPELDRLIREREQAEALQSDFPRLLGRLQAENPVWIPYGEPVWLVSLASGAGADPVLVAVSVDRLRALVGRSAEGVRIVQGKEGESLGDSFPGLRAVVPVGKTQSGGLGQVFLALTMAFVMGLTLLAGFLLWRDVRRDARLAELRSQFVSSVSHEPRTPLTSIRMFTESMRMDDEMDSATRAEYLDTVLHESERLSRLVENVLHFARQVIRELPGKHSDQILAALPHEPRFPLQPRLGDTRPEPPPTHHDAGIVRRLLEGALELLHVRAAEPCGVEERARQQQKAAGIATSSHDRLPACGNAYLLAALSPNSMRPSKCPKYSREASMHFLGSCRSASARIISLCFSTLTHLSSPGSRRMVMVKNAKSGTTSTSRAFARKRFPDILQMFRWNSRSDR